MDPAVLFKPEAHACKDCIQHSVKKKNTHDTLKKGERWTCASSPPLTSQDLATGLTVIIHKNPKPKGGILQISSNRDYQIEAKVKNKKVRSTSTKPQKLLNKIYPLKAACRRNFQAWEFTSVKENFCDDKGGGVQWTQCMRNHWNKMKPQWIQHQTLAEYG